MKTFTTPDGAPLVIADGKISGLVKICQEERVQWETLFETTDGGSDEELRRRTREARLSHLEDWTRQRGDNRRVLGAFAKAWGMTPRTIRYDMRAVSRKQKVWAKKAIADPDAERTRIFEALGECAEAAFDTGDFKASIAARMAQAKMLGLDKSVLEVRATAAEPLTPEQMREQFAQLPPAVRHAMIRDLSAVDDGVITLPDADVRRIG